VLESIGAVNHVPKSLDLLKAGPEEVGDVTVTFSAASNAGLRDIAAMEFGVRIMLVPDR